MAFDSYFCMQGFMNSEQINLFAHSYTISLIFRLMWEGEISYQMSIVMAVKSDWAAKGKFNKCSRLITSWKINWIFTNKVDPTSCQELQEWQEIASLKQMVTIKYENLIAFRIFWDHLVWFQPGFKWYYQIQFDFDKFKDISERYVYSLIFKIIFFVLFSILLRQICWERERDISHVFTRADVEQTMLMEISWRRWAELQEQESYKTKMYF